MAYYYRIIRIRRLKTQTLDRCQAAAHHVAEWAKICLLAWALIALLWVPIVAVTYSFSCYF